VLLPGPIMVIFRRPK